MKGFTSLRALYLFEKSEYLEEKARQLENQNCHAYETYMQAACYLRCDADEAEAEYAERNNKATTRK